jgi:hypothetical protein
MSSKRSFLFLFVCSETPLHGSSCSVVTFTVCSTK